ncbi:MAG TPA: hypothetical protein VFO16_18105, partial [Pseudonocardiaceae bacterium]|nr:hypothetical protein [Pseudonocardiaceae bacterium]
LVMRMLEALDVWTEAGDTHSVTDLDPNPLLRDGELLGFLAQWHLPDVNRSQLRTFRPHRHPRRTVRLARRSPGPASLATQPIVPVIPRPVCGDVSPIPNHAMPLAW